MSLARTSLFLFFALTYGSAQDGSALRIAAGSPLPPAVAGVNYALNLPAAGGVPPYTWEVASGILPAGLTLSASGLISGMPAGLAAETVTFQVTDRAGARAVQALLLNVIAATNLPRAGVLTQIAAGGDWSTSITLVNGSAQAIPLRIAFYADDGSGLTLPLTVRQQGFSRSVSGRELDGALNPNTALVVETGALGSTVTGWAEVLSPGPIGGHAVFRTTQAGGPASEGTAPLWTQAPSTFTVAFDHVSRHVFAVALANPSALPAEVSITTWDDNGAQIGLQTITLPGRGHTAFGLPDLIEATAGRRGIVRFQSGGTGGLAGLGLRFSTEQRTFTSIPGI